MRTLINQTNKKLLQKLKSYTKWSHEIKNSRFKSASSNTKSNLSFKQLNLIDKQWMSATYPSSLKSSNWLHKWSPFLNYRKKKMLNLEPFCKKVDSSNSSIRNKLKRLSKWRFKFRLWPLKMTKFDIRNTFLMKKSPKNKL